MCLNLGVRIVHELAGLGLNVKRTWEIVDHGVDQILNALVFEGGTTGHWDDLVGDHRAAKRFLDFLDRDWQFFEELHAELFVLVANFCNEAVVSFLRLGDFRAFKVTH